MKLVPQTKLGKVFLAVIILVLLFFFLLLGLQFYKQYKGEKRIEELAQELERLEREDYERKAADTIGGQTPQETLAMFIEAVEEGNYELASKYFAIERQEGGQRELVALEEENNLEQFINLLEKAEPDGEIVDGYFRMKAKTEMGPHYFVRFAQYPSGNWKIEEI